MEMVYCVTLTCNKSALVPSALTVDTALAVSRRTRSSTRCRTSCTAAQVRPGAGPNNRARIRAGGCNLCPGNALLY